MGHSRAGWGDNVSLLFGTGKITGKIVEDRGRLGKAGRRLYGIRFELGPSIQVYIEMPEEGWAVIVRCIPVPETAQ
jgi:hypothetical protein